MDALYADLAPRGLEILAFPSGEFGGQELATDGEIQAWAKGRGTSFPVFAKASVNGVDEIPVYTFLKSRLGGVFQEVKWNFGKFLVDGATGLPVRRYGPKVAPADIRADVEALL